MPSAWTLSAHRHTTSIGTMHLFSGFLLCFSEVKLAKVAGNFSPKKLKKIPLVLLPGGFGAGGCRGSKVTACKRNTNGSRIPRASSMREKACSKVGAVQLAATELRKVELRKAPAQTQVLKSEQLERLAGS